MHNINIMQYYITLKRNRSQDIIPQNRHVYRTIVLHTARSYDESTTISSAEFKCTETNSIDKDDASNSDLYCSHSSMHRALANPSGSFHRTPLPTLPQEHHSKAYLRLGCADALTIASAPRGFLLSSAAHPAYACGLCVRGQYWHANLVLWAHFRATANPVAP